MKKKLTIIIVDFRGYRAFSVGIDNQKHCLEKFTIKDTFILLKI